MKSKLIALLGKSPRDRLASLKALAARYPHYGDLRQVYRQGFRPLTTRVRIPTKTASDSD